MNRIIALRRALIGVCALSTTPAVAQETQPQPETEDAEEEIVVQATRSNRRVQDEPIRVEVLNLEEIGEKLMMRPGNISMVLAETGGLRVQTTSPSLGGANIRVQGLNGRYTQLLADGLPLYGGQSLGLLQIPPTDLGQVEVIKGAASALYGPSALGGVINLVSRRPTDTFEAETLLNVTSRDGQDLTAYVATPLGGGWSGSLTGGLHRQTGDDLNGDDWFDIPAYERWTIRPRLFWRGDSGASLFLTLGAMGEDRTGGTLPGRNAPGGRPFVQAQESSRLDVGIVAEAPLSPALTGQLRGSWMRQEHRHTYGDVIEPDTHETLFAEASIASRTPGRAIILGAVFQADYYRSEAFPAQDYSFTSPALFSQIEQDLRDDLVIAASARMDAHNEYGTRLSPRVSLLYRPGAWTMRMSWGRGFFAPTPFVDEIEDAGLSRLTPLRNVRAETAETGSIDIGYTAGPIEAHVTLFAANLSDAVQIVPTAADRVQLINVDGITRTRGAELLLRYRRGPFTVTGSYVFVDSSEPDPDRLGQRRDIPLTPRHSAGVVGMWEAEGRGRIGIEAYYTGRQSLEDDPFRTQSRPYVELGALGEIILGRVRLFVNAENILDVRQTRYSPLLRPARAPDGRWTVDGWAPNDGFTVNAGVRIRFGGS